MAVAASAEGAVSPWPPATVAHLPRPAPWELSAGALSLAERPVLGSKSAARRAALGAMALPGGFTFRSADVDERALGDRTHGADPEALVRLLGEAKGVAVARAVASDESAAAAAAGGGGGEGKGVGAGACTCVLTGDQVVVRDGRILEKPTDAAEARAFIEAYSGGECSTVGSCTATDPATGAQHTVVEVATIEFGPIPDVGALADALVADGEVFYCAGALMAEHPLVVPHIRTVRGASIDSVLGLSPTAVAAALNGLAAKLQADRK